MKYFKDFIISLKEIAIFYILEYIVLFGSCLIYVLSGGSNLLEYIIKYTSIIITGFNILAIIFILKKYYHRENKLNKKDIFPIILLGIGIAVLLNMILFKLGNPITKGSVSFIILIISTGVVGPILEELLFRYIYLNKLLKFNNETNSIMISAVIFAMLHGNIFNIMYALILGLLFNKIYLKYRNIWMTIIMHICANIIVLFLYNYNIYLLILSIILCVISYIGINDKFKLH